MRVRAEAIDWRLTMGGRMRACGCELAARPTKTDRKGRPPAVQYGRAGPDVGAVPVQGILRITRTRTCPANPFPRIADRRFRVLPPGSVFRVQERDKLSDTIASSKVITRCCTLRSRSRAALRRGPTISGGSSTVTAVAGWPARGAFRARGRIIREGHGDDPLPSTASAAPAPDQAPLA